MMRKLKIGMAILAGAATMLVVVGVLLFVTERVARIEMPLLHAAAVMVTLVAGVLLLVSATYFSTHLVVRLYRDEASSDPGSAAINR